MRFSVRRKKILYVRSFFVLKTKYIYVLIIIDVVIQHVLLKKKIFGLCTYDMHFVFTNSKITLSVYRF